MAVYLQATVHCVKKNNQIFSSHALHSAYIILYCMQKNQGIEALSAHFSAVHMHIFI